MKSKYTPFLVFHPEKEEKIKHYQKQLSNDFFTSQKIAKYKELEINESISDIDFYSKSNDKLEMPDVYSFLFKNITKNTEGRFEQNTLYCFTYDEKLCPFKENVENREIKYGKIELAGIPIFYYIYLDIKKVFEIIKA